MTPRQQQTLSFIREYIVSHDGVSPTYATIGSALGGMTRPNVHRIVTKLVEGGRLIRQPNTSHGLRLVDGGEFERGRAIGREEGYLEAIKGFAHRATVGRRRLADVASVLALDADFMPLKVGRTDRAGKPRTSSDIAGTARK